MAHFSNLFCRGEFGVMDGLNLCTHYHFNADVARSNYQSGQTLLSTLIENHLGYDYLA